ncbi:SRPBCC family protein [Pseudonocardia oroxyli]|uniref:Polyketide cyclase / dehydrase and lipid transport n=1 Tax=Pseudonocardia oroxyli TaxID=366584 RepID=A0A1G7PWU7_PSEOR|nr:SRPBCC family protein [Pseudonocardia oroxyli]SDF90797.1 Polyketide cyclase / dehydrase and lipid transport [Pseudonocardia oroxyli]
MELTATTTVRRPVAEVYAFWRLLENLPSFMAHLDEVRTTDEKSSTWTASAPFDHTVVWEALITEDLVEERIAWRSTEQADVPNEGTVSFLPSPDGAGTEVHVHLVFDIEAGKLGRAVAKYFGEDPRQQLDDDLRRLKQVLETGEVVRSDGAPWGKRARKEFPQRPAQPLTVEERREVLGA